jgi:hypothetical protein
MVYAHHVFCFPKRALTNILPQPPKRRGAPASSSSAAPRRTRSKLAKENDITAEEENEIKEVFQLFADTNEDFPAEKDGVMPREDVRKAMVYDCIPPHPPLKGARSTILHCHSK